MTRHVTFALMLSCAMAGHAGAQLRDLGKRITKTAEARARTRADSVAAKVEDKAGKTVDRAIDAADRVVSCLLSDRTCIRNAIAGGATLAINDAAGRKVSSADSALAVSQAGVPAASAPAAPMPPSGTDPAAAPAVNVPPPLFAEDFSRTELGDFPTTLQFLSGGAEVVQWEGGRWLRTTSRIEFGIPLAESLPDRFQLEVELYPGARRHSWGDATIHFDAGRSPGMPHVVVNWTRGGLAGNDLRAVNDIGQELFKDAVVPVRVVVDGSYVRVSLGDRRVANVPQVTLQRGRKIWMKVPATEESPAYIGAIRITALPPKS